MKTWSPFQFILCLITALLASCSPQPSAPIETPPSAIEITSFPSTLKIDDISIEFLGYHQELQHFKMVICFDPPSEEVWYFEDVVFKIDNQEIPGGWVSTEIKTGRADGFDCENVGYPIESIANTGNADLSIGRLKTFVDPDNQDCNRAQKNLDKAKTGIVINCDPAIVGYPAGFVVTKKPIFMNGEDAVLVAMDAFSDTREVNWRFSFAIQKP